MKRIVFATTNPGKLREAKEFFVSKGVEVLSLRDFPDASLVEETGETFEENATLKAKGYFLQFGMPVIGDDGGLMIAALDGAPGVHSHRFLGKENPTTRELTEGILTRMHGIPKEKRIARLGGVTVFWDGEHFLKAESWTYGSITEKVMDEIQEGFPYRSILMIPSLNKVYSQLTPDERNSFRIKNLAQISDKILQYV